MNIKLNKLKKRYNFFVTPDLQEYINFIQTVKHIPMSTYMRILIESAMENDESFKKRLSNVTKQ